MTNIRSYDTIIVKYIRWNYSIINVCNNFLRWYVTKLAIEFKSETLITDKYILKNGLVPHTILDIYIYESVRFWNSVFVNTVIYDTQKCIIYYFI